MEAVKYMKLEVEFLLSAFQPKQPQSKKERRRLFDFPIVGKAKDLTFQKKVGGARFHLRIGKQNLSSNP